MSAMGQYYLLPSLCYLILKESADLQDGRRIIVKDELWCDWRDVSTSYNDIKIEGC